MTATSQSSAAAMVTKPPRSAYRSRICVVFLRSRFDTPRNGRAGRRNVRRLPPALASKHRLRQLNRVARARRHETLERRQSDPSRPSDRALVFRVNRPAILVDPHVVEIRADLNAAAALHYAERICRRSPVRTSVSRRFFRAAFEGLHRRPVGDVCAKKRLIVDLRRT